ncbi:MAG: flagellar hook-basal body complex protein [Desulfobacterota bacterium]|nr:flagellar hook-basal body complex protein [Thermodesulfobacteriota bacterium]
MGISSALYAGVSGLNTLGASMSVIGDNIANVNTIGFKSARSTFETLLAQNITGASGTSQVGRGVTLSAVDAVFAQGSFESTNEATDMAIGGKGFFMVRSPQTGLYYTRAGHFKFDEQGYLVNPAGLRVQGWILDPSSIAPRGAITDIQINATSSAPNATSKINIAVNLQNSSLFVETPATVESNPATQSKFIFADGINDSFIITDTGGGPVTIDLVTGLPGSPLREGEFYTGQQVAAALQDALNANATLAGTYTVTYNPATNQFTFLSSVNATISSTGLVNEVLGLSTTSNTALTAGTTYTDAAEVAYNVTDLNNSFSIRVDGGNAVNVQIDNGVYTIPELRKEIEDKINASLAANLQSARVDVRYDVQNDVFQIMSSSRGGQDSRIQVSAITGSSSNFLPTINITDYTEHLGKTSNGYTLPGYTESRWTNYSRFRIVAGTNDVLRVDGTDYQITGGVSGFYTGEQLARSLTTALAATGIRVTYDAATERFTFVNNGAASHTINWSHANTTSEGIFGFLNTADVTLAVGETDQSDNSVSFNIITGDNDTLDIIVNGNQANSGVPITVTLSAGVYTADNLALELENKINTALSAAGESDTVKVSFDDGTGRMRIASSRLGPNSSIQINSSLGITPNVGLVGGTLQIDDATINYGQGFQVEDLNQLNPDDSSNYSTSLVVYDSLGNQHTLTFYFRKAYVSNTDKTTTWEWFAYVPAADTASGQPEAQARGTLTFNQNGILTGQSPVEWLTKQADGSAGEGFDFSGGAAPQQEVQIDFGLLAGTNLSTQYAAPSSTIFQTQDGFGSGFLQEVSVDSDGVISGLYSNGQVLYLARVALANFVNPWGLSRVGGNLWAETRQSGQPITGVPGTAGLGKIAPNSLEQSNVDLSTEFVNMIIQQRGFQANSRVITTTDDMLAELINLKR